MSAPNLRTELLTEAERLVTGDRNAQYGEPHQDFRRTADMLTAMGFRAPGGGELEAHHVALLLSCVKLSRLVWSPEKRDSWVDLAGYAACGHEAYEKTRPETGEEPLVPRERDLLAALPMDERVVGVEPLPTWASDRVFAATLPICAKTLRSPEGLVATVAGTQVYCRRTANHDGGCSNDPHYTGNVGHLNRSLPPFALRKD